jgi:hypothetical protein
MKSIILLLLVAVSLASCTNYGKKIKKGTIEVFYKEGISKEDAEKTAEILYNSVKGTANEKGRKSMQLVKGNGDTILFRMVIDKEKSAAIGDDPFKAIASVISDSVFMGKPVNMDLTTNSFKTIRSLTFVKKAVDSFGEKITSGNIEVYASDNIDAKYAKDLAGFLNNFIHPEFVISFQISKNENEEFVINMASNEKKAATITNQMLGEISTKISDEVLNGSPLLFQLTDVKFSPIRTFSYPSDIAKPDSLHGDE